MTAALPAAPTAPDVLPGWYRSACSITPRTLHRLAARPNRPVAVTVCGRSMTLPEKITTAGDPACRVCTAIMDSIGNWQRQPAPTAPANARPKHRRPAPLTVGPTGVRSDVADADPLVALMASDAYDLDRLIGQHADDGHGWCRGCGGPQSGRVRWPCPLLGTANRAALLRERTRRAS